ncbi:MAG TPA: CRISPR-associated DxTHG motif protein [Candidatus Moranbacteria bacterium]|nr:CRISPR-associated DxTHG motif protein [Candidatus Moranbacteria bacterium]
MLLDTTHSINNILNCKSVPF